MQILLNVATARAKTHGPHLNYYLIFFNHRAVRNGSKPPCVSMCADAAAAALHLPPAVNVPQCDAHASVRVGARLNAVQRRWCSGSGRGLGLGRAACLFA